jgi:hypothetical protein
MKSDSVRNASKDVTLRSATIDLSGRKAFEDVSV